MFRDDTQSRPEASKESSDNTTEPSTNSPSYPQGIRLLAILTSLVLSVFLVSLDRTIIATAIPSITDEFHSLNQIGWYGSAFFLTLASFQSTWGKAYKYFPIKSTFLTSIFIFEIGSLVSGVANDSTTLIVGRVIAGCGGAGVIAGAYTLIALNSPPKKRSAYTGLAGATYGIASVVGPLLGGVFTQNISWRWTFYVNRPIGGVSAVIIFFCLKVPKVEGTVGVSLNEKFLQMDPLGTLTIMGGMLCYLLALQWGGLTKSWSDKSVIGALVGFGTLLLLFGVLEWYLGERALLQGRLMGKRIILVASTYAILLAGSFFTLVYYLPIYFQSVSGVSPLGSGLRNLGTIVVATIFSGVVITVFGHYVPWMLVGSILATVGSGLVYTLNVGAPSSHCIGYQILAGLGIGCGFQIPIIVAQASVDADDIAPTSAIILLFQTIGGSVFVSAAQSAFANTLLSSLKSNAPLIDAAKVLATGATDIRTSFGGEETTEIVLSYLDGLHVVFAMTIALSGLSLIAALFAPWKPVNVKNILKETEKP